MKDVCQAPTHGSYSLLLPIRVFGHHSSLSMNGLSQGKISGTVGPAGCMRAVLEHGRRSPSWNAREKLGGLVGAPRYKDIYCSWLTRPRTPCSQVLPDTSDGN